MFLAFNVSCGKKKKIKTKKNVKTKLILFFMLFIRKRINSILQILKQWFCWLILWVNLTLTLFLGPFLFSVTKRIATNSCILTEKKPLPLSLIRMEHLPFHQWWLCVCFSFCHIYYFRRERERKKELIQLYHESWILITFILQHYEKEVGVWFS